MSLKKQQQKVEKQLIELVNSRANENKCGECGATYPTWASYNLGMFLCGRCASVHRRILGPSHENISKVKSLTLDTWNADQLASLGRAGNKKAKKKWNPKKIPFPYDGDDDPSVVEQYIRDKYILGKFRDESIGPGDYEDKFSRYSDDNDSENRSRSSSYVSRSRSNSYLKSVNTGGRLRSGSFRRPSTAASTARKDIPQLSHRKLTTFEYTLFSSQVAKIMECGYTNKDSILEALLLSEGVLDEAFEILDQDSKINPTQSEIPPNLPKRPSGNGGNLASGAAPATTTNPQSQEWWSQGTPQQIGAPQQTSIAQAPQQPQIYQYTDPVTGQVSFIDSNGQQYLDPNNPQHQQQLMQMSNPQLMAQNTNKQNILSLYGKPNQFSTNVAVPISAEQQQQQQQGFPQQAQSNAFPQNPQATGFQQPQSGGYGQQPQVTGYPQQFAQGYQQTGYGQQQVPQGFAAQQFQPQFTGFGQPAMYGQPQQPSQPSQPSQPQQPQWR